MIRRTLVTLTLALAAGLASPRSSPRAPPNTVQLQPLPTSPASSLAARCPRWWSRD